MTTTTPASDRRRAALGWLAAVMITLGALLTGYGASGYGWVIAIPAGLLVGIAGLIALAVRSRRRPPEDAEPDLA